MGNGRFEGTRNFEDRAQVLYDPLWDGCTICLTFTVLLQHISGRQEPLERFDVQNWLTGRTA